MKKVIIVGYSGHAFVAIDIMRSVGTSILGYTEPEEKAENPFDLPYLGSESSPEVIDQLKLHEFFVAIGDNQLRRRLTDRLEGEAGKRCISISHSSAVVSEHANLSSGVMVGANASINPMAEIGIGVICNTGSIVEHHCKVGDYAHIAPGAVLCGGVEVGRGTLIGANSVVRPMIKIGSNAVIGAGAVIVRDIADHEVTFGNQQRS